jgi:hypothetical protein
MLHVEVLGFLSNDAVMSDKVGYKTITFTIVHKEMTQVMGGHSVYIVCQYPTRNGCLVAELKKGKQVLVKGEFYIQKNTGRYGDGSISLHCRVRHLELIH